MPLYRYRAISKDGEIVTEYLSARSEEEVLRFLEGRGYDVLSLQRVREVGTPRSHKPNLRNMAVFFTQMASLLGAGVPLAEALRIMSTQFAPPFGDVIEELYNLVSSGQATLSGAMALRKEFPPHVVGTVRSGEETGNLRIALEELGEALAKADHFRSLAISAMTYPTIILTFAVLIGIGMMVFLVPQMVSTLEGLAGEDFRLPLPTQLLLAASRFITSPLGILAILVLLLGGAFGLVTAWRGQGAGREVLENLLFRLPLVGELFAKGQMITVARALALALSSGLSLHKAVDLAIASTSSLLYRRALEKVGTAVAAGVPLSRALARFPQYFSSLFRSMAEIGERSSRTVDMFRNLRSFYEEDYERRIKGLSATLEPVMMILVGGVVMFIMLAVLLPFFSVLGKLGGGL